MSLSELVVQKLAIDALSKEQRDYSKLSSDLFWNFLEDAEQIFIQRSKQHDFNIDSDEIAFLDFAVKLEDAADQMQHYSDLLNLNFAQALFKSPEETEDTAARNRLKAVIGELHSSDSSATSVYNISSFYEMFYRSYVDYYRAKEIREKQDKLYEELQRITTAFETSKLAPAITKLISLYEKARPFMISKTFKTETSHISRDAFRSNEALTQALEKNPNLAKVFSRYMRLDMTLDGLETQRNQRYDLAPAEREEFARGIFKAMTKDLKKMGFHKKNPVPLTSNDIFPLFQGAETMNPLGDIINTFSAIQDLDFFGILPGERERWFRSGNLTCLITPFQSDRAVFGENISKFSDEKRKESNEEKKTLEERLGFSSNILLVPAKIDPALLLPRMVEAFFEYKKSINPRFFKELIVSKKPFEFVYSPNLYQDSSKMQRLGIWYAAFVNYVTKGQTYQGFEKGMPEFANFCLNRLNHKGIIISKHYRVVYSDFKSALRERDPESLDRAYLKVKGETLELERKLAVLYVINGKCPNSENKKEYLEKALNHIKRLPSYTRESSEAAERYYQEALELRKEERTEAALNALSKLCKLSVTGLKDHHEKFSRPHNMDVKRELVRLRSKQVTSAQQVDHNLLGLMYAADGSYEAAFEEISEFYNTVTDQRKKSKDVNSEHSKNLLANLSAGQSMQLQLSQLKGLGEYVQEDIFAAYNLSVVIMKLIAEQGVTDKLKESLDDALVSFQMECQERYSLFTQMSAKYHEDINKADLSKWKQAHTLARKGMFYQLENIN